ncbi:MAG: hypothetical protein ACOC7S_00745 [Planctomycetota bacterium]
MNAVYVVHVEYVGPNREKHHADGDYVVLTPDPPRTNLSGEVKTEGWLGTSNDWSKWAYGRFESREAAEAFARRKWDLGEWRAYEEDPCTWGDSPEGERSYPLAHTRTYLVDAGDYYAALSPAEVLEDAGIGIDRLDVSESDLEAAAERVQQQLDEDPEINEPVELTNIVSYLKECIQRVQE